MKKLKKILVLLCVLTALTSAAYAAGPIDVNRDVSFTIEYRDGETPLPGAKFDLYRVADVDERCDVTVTKAFEPFSVDLEDLTDEDWQKLAVRLKGEAQRSLKPDASALTDAEGNALFTLKPGLYLIVGNALRLTDKAYVTDPFIIFLPGENAETREWEYVTAAQPKHTTPITIHKILKVWDPDHKDAWKNIKEISIDILCDGELFDTAVLTKDNGWSYEWDEELDPEHAHDWSFAEVEVPGFIADYEIIGSTLKITNTYIPEPPANNVTVVKKIDGSPSEKAEFTFVMKAQDPEMPMPEGSENGVKEIAIKGAGKNGFGRITFDKPGEYIYTVTEKDGGVQNYTYDKSVYTVVFTVVEKGRFLETTGVYKNANGDIVKELVFTNKYTAPGGGVLPQTGLLWWPVPVLLAAGLLMVLFGVMRRKGNRDEE